MPTQSFPFSKKQFDKLEDILFDAKFDEDSLDLFGIQGMICAFVISPESVPKADWVSHITGNPETLPPADYEVVKKCLDMLATHLLEQMNAGQIIQMPPEVYEDEAALSNWCAGFVEGFLTNEKAWFKDQDEAAVAKLLLPMMVHSELYEDEEFQDIHNNDQLMAQMAIEIPDNLLDLYVLYRA